ncbi:hypothetical protein K437DRAFT_258700 [Tilletiaria anomala UBC 951]|uniref:Mg-dependent DNase n=1 Tax=Tilletiaria anomala (strain ATCC 24038 / CBS 436.72 / UBC 951) TaxID=1037660 RepID=A0A066VP94_TILAU|nr:uncharacterized protein K437DRAFT_258700 [Tilletiaria anomala UBC 951]KDN40360.1 hypothetical protein K437DRAFT_258700 [Tilletiaria anomala UBC 951]
MGVTTAHSRDRLFANSASSSAAGSVGVRRSPAPIIDIGVNLAAKAYSPSALPAIFSRAAEAGVTHFLITGTSLRGSKDSIALCKAFSPGGQRHAEAGGVKVAATAGVHPHDAQRAASQKGWVAHLRTMIEENTHCVMAIGECGLDYNRMFSPKQVQLDVFRAQMTLAAQVRLPVFLHCRDAFEDFAAILAEPEYASIIKVVHCHTDSDAKHLDTLLQLGVYVGITGWITDDRRGRELAEIVGRIPLEKLMIETDAPYLLPRNMPRPWPSNNEPAYLPWVLKKVAECYGISEVEVANATTHNAKTVFKPRPRQSAAPPH